MPNNDEKNNYSNRGKTRPHKVEHNKKRKTIYTKKNY